jgi:hypothetical protein
MKPQSGLRTAGRMWMAFIVLSAFTHIGNAQQDSINALDGVWVLEKASALKVTGNDSVKIDISTIKTDQHFALFDTLEFKSSTLRLVNVDYNNFETGGIYVLRPDSIEIPFTGAPFYLEYVIQDTKLYLKQIESFPYTPSKEIYIISTTYRKEENAEDL